MAGQFAASLAAARQHELASQAKSETDQKVHVTQAGKAISSAYEQLRNAAEYTEDHLLMQRAIVRFYRRLFIASVDEDINTSGEELVTELTLAGYLANDTVDLITVEELNSLAVRYHRAYASLAESHDVQLANTWAVDVMAAEAESLLVSHAVRDVYAQLAFDVFCKSIDAKKTFAGKAPSDYELLLYAATHRALLKSNDATIRYILLQRYKQTPAKLSTYIHTNQKIDEILTSKQVEGLTRLVSRHGASLRVLLHMLNERDDVDVLLANEGAFLQAFEDHVLREYDNVKLRINRGLVKSIVFLVITKFLIGIAAEVPYDLIVHDEILWIPLIVNLFAPIVYMVTLGLTLTMPGQANTTAIVNDIDAIMYGERQKITGLAAPQRHGGIFNAIYGLLFVVIFSVATWRLWAIGFSWLHLVIFFTFFSAASFLGFRLSRMVREIEAVDSDQSTLAAIRDFIYMPFVVLGRKINEEYSKMNVMAIVLDMVIELPLKTLMRISRQWNAFIRSKKDEL